MNYFKNKEQNIQHAKSHVEYMDKNYRELTENSIDRSIIFERGRELKFFKPAFTYNANTSIRIVSCDTVVALHDFYSQYYKEHHNQFPSKTALLNFASFKNPGGMFMKGSMAQEEFLCHNSNLYNILSDKKLSRYYAENKKNLNRSLYIDKLLYSPGVVFEFTNSDNSKYIYQCDVITCAAPNASAARKYHNCGYDEICVALNSRIEYIFNTCKVCGVKNIILGAFGCGVFGNDPYSVASYFKYFLTKVYTEFDNVIIAIPGGPNLHAFECVFSEED